MSTILRAKGWLGKRIRSRKPFQRRNPLATPLRPCCTCRIPARRSTTPMAIAAEAPATMITPDGGADREGEAAAPLRAGRHLLLPGVHPRRRRRPGHARHRRRRRVHLADRSVCCSRSRRRFILAELGAAYTDEGGPYVWVRMAFGHLTGAVNNFFYWVTNPVWMGGTLVATAVGGITVLLVPRATISSPPWRCTCSGSRSSGSACSSPSCPFRIGKWIATIGGVARFALLGLFSVVVLVYGGQHGFHGPGRPTTSPGSRASSASSR